MEQKRRLKTKAWLPPTSAMSRGDVFISKIVRSFLNQTKEPFQTCPDSGSKTSISWQSFKELGRWEGRRQPGPLPTRWEQGEPNSVADIQEGVCDACWLALEPFLHLPVGGAGVFDPSWLPTPITWLMAPPPLSKHPFLGTTDSLWVEKGTSFLLPRFRPLPPTWPTQASHPGMNTTGISCRFFQALLGDTKSRSV